MNIYLSFLIIYFWTSLHTSNYVFFFVVCMFLLITIEPTRSLTPIGVKALAGNNRGSALCISLLAVWVGGSCHRENVGKMSKGTQNYYLDTGHHTHTHENRTK